MSEDEHNLFERLKALRNKRAGIAGVPAYVVFHDSTLRDMCRRLPVTEEEFMNVSGVGEMKKRKYGKEFIEEIKKFLVEKSE
jgi:ATP-dependent DNA helicase RecQ